MTDRPMNRDLSGDAADAHVRGHKRLRGDPEPEKAGEVTGAEAVKIISAGYAKGTAKANEERIVALKREIRLAPVDTKEALDRKRELERELASRLQFTRDQ